MTVLICGASGLVGQELCNFLDKKNVKYIGTYNTKLINKDNMYKIDFKNYLEVKNFLKENKITCCVFCIVERITDICEADWNKTKSTNIDLVNTVSYICCELGIRFIHLSTDYVFDGNKQPNLPNDKKNPLQNYGISKLISELKVANNCSNYCIIRTPVLYSSLSKLHENAVTLISKNIFDLRKKEKKEDNYSIRRPLYIRDLCEFIFENIYNNNIGIYHFYNPYNHFTKYKITKIISDYLNITSDHIIPDNNKFTGLTSRPYDTQLMDENINIEKYNFTGFSESIIDCFYKFKDFKINKDTFLLIDFDNTILETNKLHYNSYKIAFENNGIDFPLSYDEWNCIILKENINDYLKTNFSGIYNEIKKEKFKVLETLVHKEDVFFTKNSDKFIDILIKHNINFCVVTNTNKKTIDLFMGKIPFLKKINNWVIRDEYKLPKPNPECFQLAIKKYHKGEKNIIGIEDSYVGFDSLKNITDKIYIYNNEKIFKNEDCFYFDDFNQILEI